MSFLTISNYDIYSSSNIISSPNKKNLDYPNISPNKFFFSIDNQHQTQSNTYSSTKTNEAKSKDVKLNKPSKFEINTIVSLLRSFHGDCNKVYNAYPNMSIEEIEDIKKSKNHRISFSHSLFTYEEDELLLKSISKVGENFRKIVRIFKGKKSITEIKWRYKKLMTMNYLFDYKHNPNMSNSENNLNTLVENILYKESICQTDLNNKTTSGLSKGMTSNDDNEYIRKGIYDQIDDDSFLSLKRKRLNNECKDYNKNKLKLNMLFNKLDILYSTYLFLNEKFLYTKNSNCSLSNAENERKDYLLHQISLKFEYAVKAYNERFVVDCHESIFDMDEYEILIQKIESLLEISQILKLKNRLLMV